MDHPRWLLDTNPLGLLFRDAYAGFQAVLAAQPPAQPGVSLEVANEAAHRMSEALAGIHLALVRQAPARRGGAFDDGFEALEYAFATVVDETLLNAPWQGRAAWGDYLLERRLFKTRSGGERLLERIDAVLQAQARAQRDIGEVYLHCLTLGFAGRLRDRADGPAALAQRREALFDWLYPDWPAIDAPGFVLTEAAEDQLPRGAPRQRSLASRMHTWLLAAGVLALPFVASAVIWFMRRPIAGEALRQIAGQR